jgi:flagellar L-ring protein FlgH
VRFFEDFNGVRMFLVRLAFGLALVSASAAFAQTNGSANAEASTSTTRERPQTAPQEGSANDDGMSTGDAYQRTGGSLMRAGRGVSAPPEPGGSQIDPRIAAQSFYAVPPPQRRIIQPRDLITIIIKEQSEFKSEGTSKLDKSADLQAAITQFIKLNLADASLENAISGVAPKIDVNAQRTFDGKGSAERKDSLSVRMQAIVVDVKPNGTLVLSARRRIKTDDEERVYLVSGLARVEDVTTDNTVLSTQMYDFDLRQDSKGTVREATKRGWLPRLLDAINPF